CGSPAISGGQHPLLLSVIDNFLTVSAKMHSIGAMPFMHLLAQPHTSPLISLSLSFSLFFFISLFLHFSLISPSFYPVPLCISFEVVFLSGFPSYCFPSPFCRKTQ